MLKKAIPSLFVCLLAATPAFSQSKTEADEKIAALTVLKKYSETVSCITNFEEEKSVRKFLKNVYTIERNEENGSVTYFILWHGDIGCQGGSGTNSAMISEVSRSYGSGPLIVQNNDAFGEDFSEKINMRFIEKIQQVSDSRFLVVSSEFGDHDANNFPSWKYQYTVDKIGFQWKVTNKKFLGKNTY